MTEFQILSLTLGLLMISMAFWGLNHPDSTQRFLRELPRNEWIGRALFLIDVIWFLYVLQNMNLSEWETISPFGLLIPVKQTALFLSPLFYIFVIVFVNPYLGARSVGIFLMLLANPILRSCYLTDSSWSILLAFVAYIWILMGIFFVASPHWMRDMVRFFSATPSRWAMACKTRIILGLTLIIAGALAR